MQHTRLLAQDRKIMATHSTDTKQGQLGELTNFVEVSNRNTGEGFLTEETTQRQLCYQSPPQHR